MNFTIDQLNNFSSNFNTKNICIDKLDDIVYKCNTYHRTIKIKPVDVKSNTYINYSKEINAKDLKFKIGGIVRISKYKNNKNRFKKCNSCKNAMLIHQNLLKKLI